MVLLASLVLIGGLARTEPQGSAAQPAAQPRPKGAMPDLYAIEPGERPGSDAEHQLSQDAYWQTRITYPTGKFNAKWLADAALQDRLNVSRAVPAGRVTYNPPNNPSLVTLDPNSWTNLGPAPL